MNIRHAFDASATRRTFLAAVCLLAFGMVVSGCDSITDFDEINKNPNNPVQPESAQIIPGLQASFSYEVIGNTAPRITNLWMQQTATNGDEPGRDRYQVNPSGPNNLWTFSLWSGAMKNAREVQAAGRSEGNPVNVGIGQVIEAWSWMVVADLWDKVPVQQAFQPEETTPAYDNQEVAYDTLFAKLERARQNLSDQLSPSAEPIGAQDFVYNGNAQKWISLAWALEARAHLHLTESGYEAGLGDESASKQNRAQAALSAAQNAFPNGNADNATFAYPGSENGENPWYQYTIQDVWILNYQMNAQYVNFLKDRDDPRLGVQARQVGAIDADADVPSDPSGFSRTPFDPATMLDLSDGTYTGFEIGTDGVQVADISSLGTHYSAADAPLTWFRYAEVEFIKAEANHILGNAGPARQAFEAGIRASLDELDVKELNGVDQTFVDNFVSDRLSAYDSASDKLGEIIREKYIANFLLLEPFNDWRRTGYPELQPHPDAQTDNGEIALRFPYTTSELNNNADEVPTGEVGGTGVRSLDAPVGWDQDQ